jgi:sodium:solute symporter family protein
VAVPAMVSGSGFTYIQMCLGFVVGYVVVATVLLPIFYKNGLTSIYGYLKDRFGEATYRTGAWFFIVSKIITSSSKLYVAILVLQQFLFAGFNIPLWLTVVICVAMIWLYTFRGGIKTIVFTDALQSVVLFVTIILMIINMTDLLGLSSKAAIKAIYESPMSHTFVFDDWVSDKNFFKQFLSGVFIVIAMTGLSQDMMQTTLSCRNLKDAQKNMLSYGVCFVPFNLLLLSLGVLMIMFLNGHNIAMPDNLNSLVPMFAADYFTQAVAIMFVVGIIAATFNSADSAMTSIATIFFVDILRKNDDTARSISLRKWVYSAVCVVFIVVIMLLYSVKNQNLLDTIYTIVGYAYGPLLGLFAFGLFTHWDIKDKVLPVLAIVSPLLTYALSYVCQVLFGYKFGYEILLINASFMFVMMVFITNNKVKHKKLIDKQ